jgi:hypothetical protein
MTKGWDNHEDSFEETLRREMLKYKGLYHLLQVFLNNLILKLIMNYSLRNHLLNHLILLLKKLDGMLIELMEHKEH